MGELLRSKGFVWVASSNKIMGGWQQAGNVIRMEGEGLWMCENPALWKGTGTEELVLKDMRKESGEDWPFGDRRQELVFIGIKLSIDAIQNTLDSVSYFLFIILLRYGLQAKGQEISKVNFLETLLPQAPNSKLIFFECFLALPLKWVKSKKYMHIIN